MVGGVGEPGRTKAFRTLHDAQIFALKLWFAFSNVFAKPRQTRRTSTGGTPARGLVHRPARAAFVGAFLGCLTTLYLCAFGIAPGIASALATSLICGQVLIMRATGLLPADFFTAAYGGSFGGMTPVLLLYQGGADHRLMLASVLFVSLSIVSGLVFAVVAEIDARSNRRFASGYGGRSGAIATLSSLLFVALAPMFGADGRPFRSFPADARELDLTSAALTCTACAVGLFATMTALRWRSTAKANQADRTFVASAIALIGMASLYLNDPGDTRLLDAFYAGCFLGMSAPERLGGWFQPLLGALVLTVVLVLVRMLLPGLGGGLGLAAFVTMLVVVALTFRARPQGRMARRATGTIAYPMAGALALGCLVLLLVSVPQQPSLDHATQAEATMPAAPSPAPVALAVSHEANDAPPLEASAAGAGGVDLAISLELPHDIKMEAHALPESGEQPSQQHSNAAVSTVRDAASAEANDTAVRATSDGAQAVLAEPQRDRAPVDDAADADAKLFHEFMQWRAAHGGGTVQGQPQPARTKPRPAQLVGLVAPAPAQPRPVRPDRPRPPSSIDPTGWPLSMHPSRPPRPIRNATGNPASNVAP
jgi:hypothetical protein